MKRTLKNLLCCAVLLSTGSSFALFANNQTDQQVGDSDSSQMMEQQEAENKSNSYIKHDDTE